MGNVVLKNVQGIDDEMAYSLHEVDPAVFSRVLLAHGRHDAGGLRVLLGRAARALAAQKWGHHPCDRTRKEREMFV